MGIRLAVLGSGSAGNATCIEGEGARVLVDAGFSCRELISRLRAVGVEPHRIDAVIVTHEHADHVRGAPLFSRTHGVPIYCTRATHRAAGLDRQNVHATVEIDPETPFAIEGLTIRPFKVPHDAVETIGCTIEGNGARVGYATDLGHGAEAVREGLRDCDLLILESNHDVEMLRAGPYPETIKRRVLSRHGHLDNESAADLAAESASDRTRSIVLAHISRTNNRPDLALRAAQHRFDRAGRRAPRISAADQGRPSSWFEI